MFQTATTPGTQQGTTLGLSLQPVAGQMRPLGTYSSSASGEPSQMKCLGGYSECSPLAIQDSGSP